MIKTLKKALFWFTVVFGALAVIEQLKLPPEQRRWHGEVHGVPYDFRPPTAARIRSRWWNPDDSRLFTPRASGVGWDVNLHRLVHLVSQAAKGVSKDVRS